MLHANSTSFSELTSENPWLNLSSGYIDEDNDEQGSKSDFIDKYLWMYVSPIVFVVGLIGNSLIIILMRRKKLQGTTSCVYLSLLAMADIATLFFGIIPEWLEHTDIIILKEVDQWVCKFEKFLFYTSSDIAIWILCAFTIDRFIAVCFPLKKSRICVKKNAKIICVCIASVAVLKNFPVFWTRGSTYKEDGSLHKNCGRPEPFANFELYIRPWIAFAMVSAIPFITILICNTMIIRKLLQVKKMHINQSIRGRKTFTQTTLMCMSASLTFLLLITPSIVLLIGRPYWQADASGKNNKAYFQAKSVANQLAYFNHAINFFIYCLTGERFRTELALLFRRREEQKFHAGIHGGVRKLDKTARKYSETNLFADTQADTVITNPNGIDININGSVLPPTKHEQIVRETVA